MSRCSIDARKPRHDLEKFKAAMRHRLTATKAAIDGGAAVGLKSRDIAAFLQTVERRHFVKSTTSYADHRQWHDVYNTPFEDVVVYIKFTDCVLTEFVLLSLKEK